MYKQTIYIGIAKDQHDNILPLCWHTKKQRAGDVAQQLAKQIGANFVGVIHCNEADYEAQASFPDDHFLNLPYKNVESEIEEVRGADPST
ncbi:MAG: hypothetical protein KME50_12920 [Nostoc desertorum CM1-VF14]|jgi:hypothetical protein|nr:hypothetical protein [Nostoc desertorum CM1-VF14]